jgi:hypothetical protein
MAKSSATIDTAWLIAPDEINELSGKAVISGPLVPIFEDSRLRVPVNDRVSMGIRPVRR